MTNTNDGGPAFPQGKSKTAGTLSVTDIQGGMSLRDWFAGQALVAMGDRRWDGDDEETATQKSAKACYSIADAMLAAREKGGSA